MKKSISHKCPFKNIPKLICIEFYLLIIKYTLF